MSVDMETEYWVPEHVREHLRSLGFVLPIEAMEGHVHTWHGWMEATGSFYDYRDQDGFGRLYEVHRRSTHPAMRVCKEWGSLLLNDKTQRLSAYADNLWQKALNRASRTAANKS